jgi:hypothetical protein
MIVIFIRKFRPRLCGKNRLQTDSCNNVPLGTTVSFSVDLRASKCIDGGAKFTISPVGLKQVPNSMRFLVFMLCAV